MRVMVRRHGPAVSPSSTSSIPTATSSKSTARRSHARLILFTCGVTRRRILDHQQTRAMKGYDHWKATEPDPRLHAKELSERVIKGKQPVFSRDWEISLSGGVHMNLFLLPP